MTDDDAMDSAVDDVLDALVRGDVSGARALTAALDDEARARLDELLGADDADRLRRDDVDDEHDPFRVEVPGDDAPSGDVESEELFVRFFGGRRDLFAEQRVTRSGRTIYFPVRAPLSTSVVRDHLAGARTVGQYLLHPDGACSFGVLDLDLAADALARLRATLGDDVSVVHHGPLAVLARRLASSSARLGLSAFTFLSGGRGVHLWLFFAPRRPARLVRQVLQQILIGAGPVPADVTIEVFPKQEQAGPRGLSSLVKLPLGVHRRTLTRCVLLDDDLRPIEDHTVALSRLRVVDNDVLDAVAGGRVVPFPVGASPELAGQQVDADARPRLLTASADDAPRDLAEALQALQQRWQRSTPMTRSCRCWPAWPRPAPAT